MEKQDILITISVLLMSLMASSTAAPFGPDLVVNTNYGDVKGIEWTESYAFMGIPYAKPPVGSLRFAAPQKPDALDGTLMANMSRANIGCMQKCVQPVQACPTEITEDCLVLNIWVPKTVMADNTLRPVFIFMHGGSFQDGAGGVVLYDSRFFVEFTDAISVTINYRTEAFGFLFIGDVFDPDLGEQAFLANYGTKDQQMAMRYVQENIVMFGGDPNKVTIAGQSAGAQSVGLHLQSEISRPLFQQAIMFSNPLAFPYKLPPDGLKLQEFFAEELGCPSRDVECFRGKTSYEVLQASLIARGRLVNPRELLQIFENWNPTVGEGEFPEEPMKAFKNGNFQKKPTMIGSVSEEGRLFLWFLLREPIGQLFYRAFLRLVIPDYGKELIDLYPPVAGWDQREVLTDFATDYLFFCPSLNVSEEMSLNGEADVFHYVFDDAFSFSSFWGEDIPFCQDHVCHGGDLPYVFRNAALVGEKFLPGEQDMADDMASYISNFLFTGNPNSPGSDTLRAKQKENLPFWPRVHEKPGKRYTMYYSECRDSVITDYKQRYCDFHNMMGYYGVSYLNMVPESPEKRNFESIADLFSDLSHLEDFDSLRHKYIYDLD